MYSYLCALLLVIHFASLFVFEQFLSMKLATVNPQMDFNLEALLAKDVRELQLRGGSSSATPFPQNMPMVYPPLPHGFMQQTLSSIGRNISSPLSPINGGYKRQVL